MVGQQRPRQKSRRGVLLLIVLSLLVLFLLVGLSFLVSASQFNRLAKSASRTDNTGMPGAKLADAALFQLVRGTANPYSAIHGHSLLEDLYGRDYIVISTTGNVSSPSSQQVQRVRINLSDAKNYRLGQPLAEDAFFGRQELRDDYYNGCVLTFLNGTAKGMSTRVLAYKPNATPPQIVFQGIAAQDPVSGEFEKPKKTIGEPLRFIINGRAFNGTGAGYNPVSGGMDLKVGKVPIAFLPNYRAYRESSELQQYLQTKMTVTADAFGRPIINNEDSVAYDYGGLDESWDCVDFQNFFLAKSADLRKAQNAAMANLEFEIDDGIVDGEQLVLEGMKSELLSYLQKTGGSTPSFHRPYLLSYLDRTAGDTGAASFATARPSTSHHPAFTGSNPQFDPVKGPWDVDANGDGIPDSIWIDAGLAPVSGPDGRLYKPLVATHVVDLDGRININTVGSLEREKISMYPGMQRLEAPGAVVPVSGAMLPITPADRSAFGTGYGAAEINSGLTPLEATNLLRSRYAGHRKDDEQKTAESAFDPDTGDWFTAAEQPLLQYRETAVPGLGPGGGRRATNFSDDDLTHGSKPPPYVPDNFGDVGRTSIDTGFGSPPDPHGRMIPYLDALGHIVWAGGDSADRYDNVDDPYEINLLSKDQHDNAYDLSDLEALQRFDLPDVAVRSRAVQRVLAGGVEPTSLQDYTTHSFSIPTPPTLAPGEFRGFGRSRARSAGGLRRSMREVFAAHIMRVHSESSRSITFEEAFAQAERIMAPELLRGERIDLNRVLVPNKPSAGRASSRNRLQFFHTPEERQQLLNEKEKFARHLFNLLMLLGDQGRKDSFEPFSGSFRLRGAFERPHVHRLAQWCINVVDFGDADSVMTRFRFDVNPFNAVEVFDERGNVVNTTELREVWGMEYPEYLLTETLAFHDLRAEDSAEGGGTLEEGDPDLDSVIKPEGAAFVELLCMGPKRHERKDAWKHVTRRWPEDLHSNQDIGWLGDTRAFATEYRKPLWRLAISDIHETGNTPRDVWFGVRGGIPRLTHIADFEPRPGPFELPGLGEAIDVELERFVWLSWFRRQPNDSVEWPEGDEENDDNTFLVTTATNRIRPGQYLVIGPESDVEVGLTKEKEKSPQRISVLGDLRQLGFAADHRRVDGTRLRPIPPAVERAAANGLGLLDTGGLVAATQGRAGFNISEPVGGYPSKSSSEPLDADAPFGMDTRTIRDFRTVFLQRLADPSLPWNPHEGREGHDITLPVNPYRTIDWMPMDLTVFNSLHDSATTRRNLEVDRGHGAFLASREKSGVSRVAAWTNDRSLAADFFNVWSANTDNPARSRHDERDRAVGSAVTELDDPSLFNSLNESTNTNVVHSLGWLNRSFDWVGIPRDGLGHYRLDDEFVEAPFMPTPPGQDPSEPAKPSPTYPTLVWNNRPYTNPYELLLVPASSSSALTMEYTVSSSSSPYTDSTNARSYRGPFGHLLNFFQSSAINRGGDLTGGGDYFRLLDFVDVPSRFRGTKTRYDDNKNSWAKLLWNNDQTQLDATSQIGLSVLPTSVSKFREPGKINLNTATDRAWDVVGFDSVLKSREVAGNELTQAQQFEESMAGGAARIKVQTPLAQVSGRYPNAVFPAEYPTPLRAGTTGDLLPQLRRLPGGLFQTGIDSTLLRRSPLANQDPILARYSLSQRRGNTAQALAYSLQNRQSNAYFRYRDLIKLGNSVTSQSNVYAIWITIGYFEIEPNVNASTGETFAVDAAHPDGYRFGIEMGSDVGQVTRHRAFYVVDRSIPVAFEPGKNHNVEKAILLRRHWE